MVVAESSFPHITVLCFECEKSTLKMHLYVYLPTRLSLLTPASPPGKEEVYKKWETHTQTHCMSDRLPSFSESPCHTLLTTANSAGIACWCPLTSHRNRAGAPPIEQYVGNRSEDNGDGDWLIRSGFLDTNRYSQKVSTNHH